MNVYLEKQIKEVLPKEFYKIVKQVEVTSQGQTIRDNIVNVINFDNIPAKSFKEFHNLMRKKGLLLLRYKQSTNELNVIR